MKKLILKGCLVVMLAWALVLPFALMQTSTVSAATVNSSPVGQTEVRFSNNKSGECEHAHNKHECERQKRERERERERHKHECERHKHKHEKCE